MSDNNLDNIKLSTLSSSSSLPPPTINERYPVDDRHISFTLLKTFIDYLTPYLHSMTDSSCYPSDQTNEKITPLIECGRITDAYYYCSKESQGFADKTRDDFIISYRNLLNLKVSKNANQWNKQIVKNNGWLERAFKSFFKTVQNTSTSHPNNSSVHPIPESSSYEHIQFSHKWRTTNDAKNAGSYMHVFYGPHIMDIVKNEYGLSDFINEVPGRIHHSRWI